MKKRIVAVILIVSLLAAGTYLSLQAYGAFKGFIHKQKIISQRRRGWDQLARDVKSRARRLNGKVGLVVEDLDSGLKVEINEDMVVPSASLAKIPVMAACFYAASQGGIRLDEKITLKKSDKVSGSGKLKLEKSGKEYTIEELVELMITKSDNTAANMVINRLGMEYLNDSFKKMGLSNTNLVRKMMDFKSRSRGIENYTTAEDMALLMEKMYRNRLYNPYVSKKCIEVLKKQKVNDRIPKKLPSGTVVAHKTGLERGVCHDVGIVYTPKGDYVISALTKHRNTTSRKSKRVIGDISSIVYKYYMDNKEPI